MKTVQQAHAAGRRDGEAGLGPLAPRDGPAGSLAHQLHSAYVQSYRDHLVARVGLPERRHLPRGKNPPPRSPANPVRVTQRPVNRSTQAWLDRERARRHRAIRTELAANPPRSTNPRRPAPRRAKRTPRGKTVTTVTRSKVIRRTNPRSVVLYATKPGMQRLKYVGGDKFAARGRAVLFPTAAIAQVVARILRNCYAKALHGWTLTAK